MSLVIPCEHVLMVLSMFRLSSWWVFMGVASLMCLGHTVPLALTILMYALPLVCCYKGSPMCHMSPVFIFLYMCIHVNNKIANLFITCICRFLPCSFYIKWLPNLVACYFTTYPRWCQVSTFSVLWIKFYTKTSCLLLDNYLFSHLYILSTSKINSCPHRA